MALEVTTVNRNLHQRVTFMGLEFEDLFVVLAMAAVMNIAGRFVSGEVSGIPLSALVQYAVPLSVIPLLVVFKYGKPRGYVRDLALWYVKPRAYCALSRDRSINCSYLAEEQE
jgi:hypothetical protein